HDYLVDLVFADKAEGAEHLESDRRVRVWATIPAAVLCTPGRTGAAQVAQNAFLHCLEHFLRDIRTRHDSTAEVRCDRKDTLHFTRADVWECVQHCAHHDYAPELEESNNLVPARLRVRPNPRDEALVHPVVVGGPHPS